MKEFFNLMPGFQSVEITAFYQIKVYLSLFEDNPKLNNFCKRSFLISVESVESDEMPAF